MNEMMKLALERARETMNKNFGGPFGAVVVKGDKILSIASNSVLRDNDPTAHAEINAIREAGKALNSYDLTGCTLYTTAVIWANIKEVYVACLPDDAAKIGFRDDFIYKFLKNDLANQDIVKFHHLDRDDCLKLFDEYKEKDKTIY